MIFEITENPIAPDAFYRQVLQDSNGAVVTFCGVVRNHANNKPTRYLVYEAYPEMAKKKMAEIGAQVAARWGIHDLGIIHRVGRLEIGEISVLIAVSSPHRAEAFEACRYAIDRLKEIVPIWKKEVGENGEEWVEGPGAAVQKG
jgi:molybdopterin synthase catalytic subunit